MDKTIMNGLTYKRNKNDKGIKAVSRHSGIRLVNARGEYVFISNTIIDHLIRTSDSVDMVCNDISEYIRKKQ